MNDKEKLDISDQVYGKIENGQVNFYSDNAKIGQIHENVLNKITLSPGYAFDQGRFYQYEETKKQPNEKYVEGCDLGWC